MKRIARVIYGKNESGREYYEIQTLCENDEWEMMHRYYFYEEDYLYFQIVQDILGLNDLGYTVHGVVDLT